MFGSMPNPTAAAVCDAASRDCPRTGILKDCYAHG